MALTKGHKINVGRKLSEETKRKIGEANKIKATEYLLSHPERRELLSKVWKGRKHSEETKLKISLGNKGKLKPQTPEHKKKLSLARLGKYEGENHPNWQGGKTPESQKIRKSVEYKQWVSNVFQRDNWTCQTCWVRGAKLEAHHIKSFAYFPELRFDVENGVTLCRSCHQLTDNYAFKALKDKNIKK